jgi:hypothetical protein
VAADCPHRRFSGSQGSFLENFKRCGGEAGLYERHREKQGFWRLLVKNDDDLGKTMIFRPSP